MRLPLVAELDARAGDSDKDARMTNVLAEVDEGALLAVVRPGLSTSASLSGAGNGLIPFNGQLIKIFGNTAYVTGGSFNILTGTFTPT